MPDTKPPIKFNKEDKRVIQELHLLTGKSFEDCREFLEGLATMCLYHYLEDSHVHFPLIGNLSVVYSGDQITNKGREAKINTSFEPDPFLKRIIGQTVDGDETDIEKQVRYRIAKTMKAFVDK